MTPPLFLVMPAALDADVVVIDGDEGRHAADVRRLRVGERVDVGDGAGRVVNGHVATVGRGRVEVSVTDRREIAAASPEFVVAQALAKGGRDEDAVEAMTEVGVDEVVGWEAVRCVAKWTDRTAAKWQATARAATKQARRPWLPRIAGPVSTAQLADRVAAAELAVVLHEDADVPLASLSTPAAGSVLVVVGPEGGITDEELALLASAGARTCRLGSAVLRSSTAGVAALSVLSAQSRWR